MSRRVVFQDRFCKPRTETGAAVTVRFKKDSQFTQKGTLVADTKLRADLEPRSTTVLEENPAEVTVDALVYPGS